MKFKMLRDFFGKQPVQKGPEYVCRINLGDKSVSAKKIIGTNTEDLPIEYREAFSTGADRVVFEGEHGPFFYRKLEDFVEAPVTGSSERVIVYGHDSPWRSKYTR